MCICQQGYGNYTVKVSLQNSKSQHLKRKMKALLGKALQRVVIFYSYGLFIAWIFTFIEKTDEPAHKKMDKALEYLKNEMDRKYNVTEHDFNDFVQRATEAVKMGEELDWTFLNSCGFVFASLTTVGYGHMTPRTTPGQGITIIICLLGLPITMLAMKSAGELLASSITALVIKTETRLFKRDQPKHVKKKTFFWACTSIAILIILATVSSTSLEGWSFMQGLYAWFITLTTIGYGDFVHLETLQREVDEGKEPEYKLFWYSILLSVPYMVGLSLMSCILSVLVDSMDHIRDFRDRRLNTLRIFISLKQKLFPDARSTNDINDASQENEQYEGLGQQSKSTAV